ncbi:MAG TPA: aspartate kinase [Tenuifilaceae bacterium]|nr:aspartate kinase [Tenuifilaceae bacterium]
MSALRVFKFGGASVKSAEGIRNMAEIIRRQTSGNLVVVVSAIGKTTNALEEILSLYLAKSDEKANKLDQLKVFHTHIATELVGDSSSSHPLLAKVEQLFTELDEKMKFPPSGGYDYCYDQVVSYGELLSTTMVSFYLNQTGIRNRWIDIRKCLRSDTSYREGVVDFELSQYLCEKEFCFDSDHLFITQGFIAGTAEGTTTTLGREGSDYTAAVLANLLDATDVTIWKDVDGVLSADPKIFSNTCKLDFISYQEAIELAYCGAQVIHPKTIKPIQNKQIPLYVKSFINPEASGTTIGHSDVPLSLPPVLILKRNQALVSLTPHDFSFVIEESLSKIFAILYRHRVKVNLVQNSAISFTICVDDEHLRLPGAIEELQKTFTVRFNSNLELLTIRHYTSHVVDEMVGERIVYLQQRTRSNARFIMDARL